VECDGAQVRLCELALLGRREIDFGCWNERDIYIYIYLFIYFEVRYPVMAVGPMGGRCGLTWGQISMIA